jgi:hypothetical protein
MTEARVLQIVRRFPENGLKQVLTRSANLRELLTLTRTALLPRLDFQALQVDPTTYVTAEYRHVCSDLVLTLPLRPTAKGKRKKPLTVSILIELLCGGPHKYSYRKATWAIKRASTKS